MAESTPFRLQLSGPVNRIVAGVVRKSQVFYAVDIRYMGYADYSMPNEKPLLNFVVEPDLLKRIDDFRYKQRFPTRAAAIKWLLDWALSQKPAPKQE